jgi:hypothetical protein
MHFLKKFPFFSLKKKKLAKIGRIEKINIPKFDLYNIDAKIDTGAYRGTIHAEDIREFTTKKGKQFLEFKVIDENNPEDQKILHKTSKYRVVKVRSSQSPLDERYAVPVVIELAGRKIKTELSLSNRTELRYPVLIGRKSLRNRFLVDVSQERIN